MFIVKLVTGDLSPGPTTNKSTRLSPSTTLKPLWEEVIRTGIDMRN